MFTELEKKSLSSALTSLLQTTTTPRAGSCVPAGSCGTAQDFPFLQQDLPPNTPDAPSRITINPAFDQLVLSVPRSLFPHWFQCGQFELLRTENERSFPKPSCDMCTNLLGQAPGGTGDFWGFLCYGNTPGYSRGGS